MPETPSSPQALRLRSFQTALAAQVHSTWLLSRPSDITYFTGFEFLVPEEREAFLLITPTVTHLWYASFSPLPLNLPTPASPMRSLHDIQQTLAQLKHTSLAIDAANLTVAEFELLSQKLAITHLDRNLIWLQRMIKDALEQELITAASRTTTAVFASIVPTISPGITEIELAQQIDAAVRSSGATPAFPTIVAFGSHSALPHHQPTTTPLTANSPILVDFGAAQAGYCSDFTRTWWHGANPTTQFTQIARIVHQAYDQAVAALSTSQKPTAAQVDSVVRQSIAQAGFGSQFIHTTGHGIGLEIHEPPSLSGANQQNLQAGMVVTIEPGIYLPGQFGYRYENSLLLTHQGSQNLTAYDQPLPQ